MGQDLQRCDWQTCPEKGRHFVKQGRDWAHKASLNAKLELRAQTDVGLSHGALFYEQCRLGAAKLLDMEFQHGTS